jgi:SAM-dependent methyltransferase
MKDKFIHGMDWTFEHEKGLGTLANYRDYQYNLISEHIGNKILEVGSGDRGFTAEIFKNKASWEKFISIEPSEGLYNQHLNTYNFGESIKFFNEDLFNIRPDSFGKFDTIIFIHVLEHIEDDLKALNHSAELLETGGKVLIEVPALPFLFSEHDKMLGHYRRYTKRILKSAIDSNKYKIEKLWYSDPIGVAGSFLYFKLLKKKLNTDEGSDLIKNQGGVYDKYIIPFEKRIEKHIRFPFGLSLNAVLHKK